MFQCDHTLIKDVYKGITCTGGYFWLLPSKFSAQQIQENPVSTIIYNESCRIVQIMLTWILLELQLYAHNEKLITICVCCLIASPKLKYFDTLFQDRITGFLLYSGQLLQGIGLKSIIDKDGIHIDMYARVNQYLVNRIPTTNRDLLEHWTKWFQ